VGVKVRDIQASRHVSISEEYNMKRMKLLPAYIVCLQITSVSYVSGQNCKSGSKNCNNVIKERDCYCCQGQYKYEDYYGYHSRYTCFECPIGEYMISDYHILQGCTSCPSGTTTSTVGGAIGSSCGFCDMGYKVDVSVFSRIIQG
jgi:hypothetical protein